MTHFPREDSTSKVVDCQFFFRTDKIRPLRLKKHFFWRHLVGQGHRKWTQINQRQLGSISGVLGTFGGLWGAPKPNRGHFWGRFFPSLTPPINPVRFLWSKMGRTGVAHIVLHILCSTRTCWGSFRPSEVSFWSFWVNKANIPPVPHFRGGRQLAKVG